MRGVSVVYDGDIALAFMGTNFGNLDRRKLLESSVLKKAMGYHCGHTITSIMVEMKLINKNGVVLKRGKDLLKEAYGHLVLNGG